MSLRFLIVEGNVRPVREAYRAFSGRTPAERYGDVMVREAGEGSFDILCPADPDASLPAGVSLADYDAVIMTGSALHLWEMQPEAVRQVELSRAIFRANVPYFGSCWAIQVAAVAAGGSVHRNPRGREIGYARDITLTAEGARHPMLAGRPARFDAPCSHLDEVATLPPDATLLASNRISRVQAAEFRFEGGTFWGVQYHPEFDHADLGFLIGKRGADLVAEGFFASEEQCKAYVADIMALDATPDLAHARWRYGLGPDVLDVGQRVTEIRNFITARVLRQPLQAIA